METFRCVVAREGPAIADAQRVRFLVYCEEEGLLSPSAGTGEREIDARDDGDSAVHFLVYAGGEPAGTVRLLLPEEGALELESKVDLDVFKQGGVSAAEVTRYCVLRRHRNTGVTAALLAGLYEESVRRGITHWLAGANMETDCPEDAAIAHRVAIEKAMMHERIRVAPRCPEVPWTARKRPFYTDEQRLRAAAGEVASLPLPRPLSVFAAGMGARFIGAPVYDGHFGVFALPLCAALADVAARRTGACAVRAFPSASSRAG
jgi:putative hemolysin